MKKFFLFNLTIACVLVISVDSLACSCGAGSARTFGFNVSSENAIRSLPANARGVLFFYQYKNQTKPEPLKPSSFSMELDSEKLPTKIKLLRVIDVTEWGHKYAVGLYLISAHNPFKVGKSYGVRFLDGKTADYNTYLRFKISEEKFPTDHTYSVKFTPLAMANEEPVTVAMPMSCSKTIPAKTQKFQYRSQQNVGKFKDSVLYFTYFKNSKDNWSVWRHYETLCRHDHLGRMPLSENTDLFFIAESDLNLRDVEFSIKGMWGTPEINDDWLESREYSFTYSSKK